MFEVHKPGVLGHIGVELLVRERKPRNPARSELEELGDEDDVPDRTLALELREKLRGVICTHRPRAQIHERTMLTRLKNVRLDVVERHARTEDDVDGLMPLPQMVA
ncbi:hypothetical protein DBT52_09460, partial [Aerococcus mictus]